MPRGSMAAEKSSSMLRSSAFPAVQPIPDSQMALSWLEWSDTVTTWKVGEASSAFRLWAANVFHGPVLVPGAPAFCVPYHTTHTRPGSPATTHGITVAFWSGGL